jgi:4-azaleucine resistance transporter AzlC
MSSDRLARDALSLGVATGTYAVSFGVLSVAAGFSVAQTAVMSLATFTGASQLTFVSVVGAGGGMAAALPPALLLAGRNTLYGLSLGGVLPRRWLPRAVAAHGVIDESTAMAHAEQDPRAKRRAFTLTALAIFVCWNAGTLVGALAGGVLGDPRDLGLDAIFPAIFLALLVAQVRDRRALGAALAGAAIALVLIPLTPAGVPVMVAALGGVPFLRRTRGAGHERPAQGRRREAPAGGPSEARATQAPAGGPSDTGAAEAAAGGARS